MTLLDEALDHIGAGDVDALKRLLAAHPELVRERFENGEDGYFKDPYLLWFVAENPIRTGALPANIVDIARVIVEAGGDQVDYALGLVASGRVARECGVQRALIDFLVDAGADPGGSRLVAALAHREQDAVDALLARGAPLTLVAAACTDQLAEIPVGASREELQLALAGAAVFGRAALIGPLVAAGADVNAYCPESFHSHSTPLHQAINVGSLATVQALLAAGADPGLRDRVFDGTALDWATHLERREIADYLRALSAS